MKRKYLAIMMGMVLSLTSMNVYAVSAAETDTTTESAEASTEETAEEELTEVASGADSELDELANAPEVIGQVTDVSEESMMISVGTLSGEETTAAAEITEAAETTESTETTEAETTEEEDAEEVTDAPEEEAVAETTASQTLTLNGQAMEVYLDDTITFQKETNPAEITVEEASEEELTESEAAEETTEAAETEAETEEETTETTEAAAEAEPAEASEELKEITISDIKVGDIVKILSDENGQVTSIIVLAEGELTDAQEEETAETTEETADETAEDGSVEETEETAEETAE